MEEDLNLSADDIAFMYSQATINVNLINTLSGLSSITDNQKDKIQRNVEHLESIKELKKMDRVTSIWTTEDFTAIDAAITLGKTKY
tara:strand:+ start:1099 stop:1356 length:258 start_codon:yes stop_codon:yes gene_type:complete